MIEVWNTISSFYANWLHPTFVSFITTLANNQYAIYALLAILVILSIVRAKVKIRRLQQVIDFINGIIVILLLIVVYNIFSPAITKFFKSTPASTPTNSSTSIQSTPTQNSTPSTQTTKQLYYSVGCYSCWNDGCPNNGYSYGGYDVNYYNYIRSLCQSCSCNSFRAQSFWK